MYRLTATCPPWVRPYRHGATKADHAERGEGNLTISRETLTWGALGPPGISRGSRLSGHPPGSRPEELAIQQPNVHAQLWRQPKEKGYLHRSVANCKHKWPLSAKNTPFLYKIPLTQPRHAICMPRTARDPALPIHLGLILLALFECDNANKILASECGC